MNKKLFLTFILFFSIINIIDKSDTIYAKNYSNSRFFVEAPDGFAVDDKTIDNYTSFIKDNINIGISVHNNELQESVINYDKTKIEEIAAETVDILNAQAGEGINVISSEIITMSKNNYPALRIVYEGGTPDDAEVYMDEYIITTENYKYTLVFSTDTAKDLDNADVKNMIDSFTVNDTMPKPSGKKNDTKDAFMLAVISGSLVFIAGAAVIVCVIKKGRSEK